MKNENSSPTYKGGEFIRAAAGGSRDILTVLLEPDTPYTEEQVGSLVDNYLKKEVKS